MTIPPATAATAADEPAPHTRENDTSSVRLAAFVARGDVLADGRVVWRRWSMPVPDGTYSTDLSFTDGTHQWYDHSETVTVVDHIIEWRIR